MKFKIGDRVKVINKEEDQFGKTGIIVDDNLGTMFPFRVDFGNGAYRNFKEQDLELCLKTLEDLEEGDMIVDEYGYERMVLGKAGKVFLVSNIFSFEECDGGYTAKEIEELGYHPKATPEETITIEGKKYRVSDITKKVKAVEGGR